MDACAPAAGSTCALSRRPTPLPAALDALRIGLLLHFEEQAAWLPAATGAGSGGPDGDRIGGGVGGSQRRTLGASRLGAMPDGDTGGAADLAAGAGGWSFARAASRVPMDLASAGSAGAGRLLAGTARTPRGCAGDHGCGGYRGRTSVEADRPAGHRSSIFGAAVVARDRRPSRPRVHSEYAPELALRTELLLGNAAAGLQPVAPASTRAAGAGVCSASASAGATPHRPLTSPIHTL